MRRKLEKGLLIILAMCLMFALGGCGKVTDDAKTGAYDSVVDITINPSFRVYLDINTNIVSVDQLNDDAKAVCQNLSLEGKSFDIGLSEIVEESINQGFVKDDKTVSVTVVEADSEVYAPDILQHTQEILTDILSAHNIEAKTNIEIAQTVIQEQQEKWNGEDQELYNNEQSNNEPVEVDCPTCNGTGTLTCWICNGQKELVCAECDGQGKFAKTCEECGGAGEKVCDECGGALYLLCDMCNGQGQQGTCRYCKGTGKCISCGGSGTEVAENGQIFPCHTCNGSGLHTNLFHGVTKPCNGKDACHQCDSTGQMRCRRCTYEEEGEPTGRIQCESCDGTGIREEACPACADGIAVCGNCNGAGQLNCEECNGTGKR